MLGNNTVVNLLQMLLHLVGSGEFFLTDGTWENLPIGSLVIEKCVSLEAVLIFEALYYLDLFTLYTSVGAVTCNVGILEQIQSSDTHILQ